MRIGLATVAFAVAASAALAEHDPEAFRIAVDSGICEELDVIEASFQEDGSVAVQCEEATAILPLLGGLGPALGAGAVAVALAAVGGGGGPSDTQ